ncbi:TetR/AcrR family transcriptional regulator [Georgenia subflava]|uniref:TetR family transcriptional regulator n=1 Tax=Georgenia subflava TaxID=1622177 RepID=A0A6N7EFH8_9MICO|nr:TetR/AcrR family transcriptional regulator [Georgenia subflava]MPV37162.1 TetR family transcriptional regulator [Georgenia subflava]
MPTDTPGPSGRRPLRRDAEQNRLRIISAAREQFAAHGLAVGHNDIARHAGVGVGTVYRHFPDRAPLVQEALGDEVARLLDVADEAMATEPAWDGLMLLVSHVADLLAANLGLRDVALGPGQLSSDFDEVADRVRGHLEHLLERAQAEGSVRPDVTPQDLTMLYFTITEVAMHAPASASRAYRRYLAIFADGLRATGSDAPLPAPLSMSDAESIARRWTSRP